jgi:hypothetical protein
LESARLLYYLTLGGLIAGTALAADKADVSAGAPAPAAVWNPPAAAQYLDQRLAWWESWSNSQRDQGTACVSCHTVLPIGLARPALRRTMGETGVTAPEHQMLDGVMKRVAMWNQVKSFYDDAKSGPGKTEGSRISEAVLNAVILANYDAERGHLSDVTRAAFKAVWALQLRDGPDAGGWKWLNFHNSPWEADESPYWGATLVALAVGIAPDNLLKDPQIQDNLEMLRGYLEREYAAQPMENRITLLWASGKWPALMTKEQRGTLIDSFFSLQHEDGGWSLASLAKFERYDHTPLETRSDGYATGIITLALEEAGVPRTQPQLARAIAWLVANQNQNEGLWTAYSVNKNRELTSDTGRFMIDAATAYSALALSEQH